MKLFQMIALGSALTAGLVMAQAPSAPAAAKTAADKVKTAKAPAAPAPTDAEIADAKTKGLVWVNLKSKKYHTSGATALYGKTSSGKFMTEADATKAGYVAAKDQAAKGTGKKAAATAKQ